MTFESQPFDNFEMAAPDGVPALRAYPAPGAFARTLIVGVAAVSLSSVAIGSPADWLQPSAVGLLWGSLFLLGIGAGGVRRGNATYACLAALYLWLSQIALQKLTSLVTSECG